MTMDLREGLGALADAAPTAVSAPDLWRRGRRRQVRRALAATVAIAAVSTIVGIGGATIVRKVESIGPVTSPSERMRLPDRFFSPSPWLKGTDDTGPIGPLVAVAPTVRQSWRSSSNGLVGVSATTGEYRFLDLPGYPPVGSFNNNEFALSADGTRLAYWVPGTITGEPLKPEGSDPPGGVAVYDTVTGDLAMRDVPTAHGLVPEGIAWAGATVRFTYDAYLTGGPNPESSWDSGFGGQVTWDTATEAWSTEQQESAAVDTFSVSQGADWFVSRTFKGAGYAVVEPAGATASFELDRSVLDAPHVNPDGARVAGIWEPDPSISDGIPRKVLWAPLVPGTPGQRLETRDVPVFRGNAVVGWRDADHVVVQRWRTPSGYFSVELTTGDSERLVIMPRFNWGGSVVAANAWAAPVVAATEPDWPMDPRKRAFLVALVVGLSLTGGWFAILWRRRVRV